jgi:hypothetical protein
LLFHLSLPLNSFSSLLNFYFILPFPFTLFISFSFTLFSSIPLFQFSLLFPLH